MKINFNAMSSMQGFGGNCIGRNARKNLNNGKNAIAADVGQLIKHSGNNHTEHAEITDIPLYRVLPVQNKEIENNDPYSMFVTERSKRNICDYDDDFEVSDMGKQDSHSISGKTENSKSNFDDMSEEYEMCRNESLELDEEDLAIMQNTKKTDEEYLEILQNYKNIDELLNTVEKLDVSEEKKHDFLMETVNRDYDFKFIDSIQISDEEKLKRKLAFIDEAYQDEGMRLKKRMQLMKSSEIK